MFGIQKKTYNSCCAADQYWHIHIKIAYNCTQFLLKQIPCIANKSFLKGTRYCVMLLAKAKIYLFFHANIDIDVNWRF